MPATNAYHGDHGDQFARHADVSPYNVHVDRPAVLRLAGDVRDATVLDAGCGAGHYAAALLDRGARVVGCDGSATLVEHARRRVAGRAELHLHDLEEPLAFLGDATVDGVVCALVYHHVVDRAGLLGEFRRVLRPGGWAVVSTTHPTADWHYAGGSYFADDWMDLPTADGAFALHYQRLTVERFVGELLGAGFALERLVEPRAVPALADVDAAAHEKLNRVPSFLAVRLVRPGGAVR